MIILRDSLNFLNFGVIGCRIYSAFYSSSPCSSDFSFSNSSSAIDSARSSFLFDVWSLSTLLSFQFDACDEMRYLRVPSFTYLDGDSFAYYTYSTNTCFYSYRTFMSFHDGRLAGVKLKHREIKSIIPGDNLCLSKIGLRVGSNTGTSRITNLCTMKPKNHTSIFSKSSLIKFSAIKMFSFSSGAK